MANSRSMYMAKKVGLDSAGSATFTPPFGCNTWQLRFVLYDAADEVTLDACDGDVKVAVSTIDEDGVEAFLSPALTPFTEDEFLTAAGAKTGSAAEITFDSTNPKVKVLFTESGGQFLTVKCKAYRHPEDIATGAYSTTDGVV